ncbi:response regulator [Nitrosospira multiformis]|uniref:Two component transcriptional regulator, LuxR family n=1 Tax=Nitrosospira multiformis (strain ATCC 25196 / NCIMB 11849 / C 71) TaxID=323848 RepID=Q2Y9N3_NITMU|nr:response regulator transcription factor [Nitrosospira multiformis]ABB74538.1 two component transcriptional regulator, LuxR family [Nitrosospira multiformis ATCC 25196]SEA23514.1 two component transcriptional regulator, LuxR family [Nitrosospira multiformis]SEF89150.1 two component transcriptional regulator, LuxR family [Nitrosospira multiformis ATCC 25196]
MIIKTFLADDHRLFRDGLRRILAETTDIVVVGEATDGLDALKKMRLGGWDVGLLDVSMPGMNGLEVLQRIMDDDPKHRILMLSTYHEDEYAIRAIRAGTSAYLTKNSPTDLLISVIRRLAHGGRYIDPKLAEKLLFDLGPSSTMPRHSALSNRELDVLKLIAVGISLTEISQKLKLSAKTISTYRARVLEKMGMQNNAQLIRYVAEHKLLE